MLASPKTKFSLVEVQQDKQSKMLVQMDGVFLCVRLDMRHPE